MIGLLLVAWSVAQAGDDVAPVPELAQPGDEASEATSATPTADDVSPVPELAQLGYYAVNCNPLYTRLPETSFVFTTDTWSAPLDRGSSMFKNVSELWAAPFGSIPATRTVADTLRVSPGVRVDREGRATWAGAPLAWSLDAGPAWVTPAVELPRFGVAGR